MNIFKKGFTDSKGGIMPSVFTSLDSKVSRPLTSRQELENWIRHNKELAGLTDAYRKGLAVSKQLASKTKMTSLRRRCRRFSSASNSPPTPPPHGSR